MSIMSHVAVKKGKGNYCYTDCAWTDNKKKANFQPFERISPQAKDGRFPIEIEEERGEAVSGNSADFPVSKASKVGGYIFFFRSR